MLLIDLNRVDRDVATVQRGKGVGTAQAPLPVLKQTEHAPCHPPVPAEPGAGPPPKIDYTIRINCFSVGPGH